jgi:type IV pilus assembly protein PilY1
MKRILLSIFSALTLVAVSAVPAMAGPDLFTGDTAIYGGEVSIKPNVLFVIDNSAGMLQQGTSQAYNPATTYTGPYSSNAVYVREAATGGTINYNSYISSINYVSCTAAKDALTGPGAYYGPLKKSNGSCDASQSGNYYLGNFLNYLVTPPPTWQSNHAYNVGDTVYPTSGSAIAYRCTQAGTSGDTAPTWVSDGSYIADGTAIWVVKPATIIELVDSVIKQVAASSRDSVNIGLMVFGDNEHGGKVLQPIRDISTTSADGTTNFNNFNSSIDGINITTLLPGNNQPVNESLWDAGLYYRGQNSSTKKISSDKVSYPSPIQYTCQNKNLIIVLTTGNTPDTQHTKSYLTDLNVNGTDGDAADASMYNLYTDKDNNYDSVNNHIVETSVIQLMSAEVPILAEASARGGGKYYHVNDGSELEKALHDQISNIVQEADTSFVAPVVPVSPENRTYSGSRVFMGFFFPKSHQNWYGNLKKYGLSTSNNLIDKNDALATFTDNNGDQKDDNDGVSTVGYINGAFRPEAESFWTDTANEGGTVQKGGAGQVLLDRETASTSTYIYDNKGPRKIYTYTGSSKNLTDATNAFTTSNASITPTLLGVSSSSDANKLINFIYGKDAYNVDSSKTGDLREWIFGDILHSRPLIVSYASYSFSKTNENDCSLNKSIIYVGSNDGMLHAINDCNGSEAWAFIPPDMLGHLDNLSGSSHSYFVDSTVSAYVYDANNNGNIETASPQNDKVVLIFGERRGGGADSAPTSGSYFALDVSDPASPKLLWQINNLTSGFGELAETWSEPKLVRMKIGSATKIVAFVGAGYDNIHEDTRYGNTKYFTDAAYVSSSDVGDGDVVSGGSNYASTLTNAKGRGIYAIEVATLSGSVPTLATTPTKIWGYVYGSTTNESVAPPNSSTNTLMRYSIPSEISALDTDNNGYADRLYVADTGGQVWRFDVGNSDVTQWRGKRLFNLNTNSATSTPIGKKFFYKPSIVVEPTYTMLFIGSGDRAHPLNRDTNLVDTFYALKDKNQTTSDNLNEGNLTDVTSDLLQTTNDSNTVSSILAGLSSSSNYGWYIKLDEHPGEKVLAAPTVFNKVAYFTTYAPDILVAPDPCEPGNLGTARLYAVNYLTGESVLNYDTGNDGGTAPNTRANNVGGGILAGSDRVMTLGSGIPSGMVLVINPGGETKALLGVGGVIASEDPKKGGSIIPIYWRQK